MNVLGKMVEAVKPGGVILDLQVIRPKPRIESDGRVVCEFVAAELLRKADAAAAAVNALVTQSRLFEEAVDDRLERNFGQRERRRPRHEGAGKNAKMRSAWDLEDRFKRERPAAAQKASETSVPAPA